MFRAPLIAVLILDYKLTSALIPFLSCFEIKNPRLIGDESTQTNTDLVWPTIFRYTLLFHAREFVAHLLSVWWHFPPQQLRVSHIHVRSPLHESSAHPLR